MSTGIIRHLDDLGRIVIPRDIRRSIGISDGDPLEIGIKDGKITLAKYQPEVPTPSALMREASAKLAGIDNAKSERLYKIAEELEKDGL